MAMATNSESCSTLCKVWNWPARAMVRRSATFIFMQPEGKPARAFGCRNSRVRFLLLPPCPRLPTQHERGKSTFHRTGGDFVAVSRCAQLVAVEQSSLEVARVMRHDRLRRARGGTADAPDLGSGPARGGGSSPLARTICGHVPGEPHSFLHTHWDHESVRPRARRRRRRPRSQAIQSRTRRRTRTIKLFECPSGGLVRV